MDASEEAEQIFYFHLISLFPRPSKTDPQGATQGPHRSIVDLKPKFLSMERRVLAENSEYLSIYSK
jgi:hypothetical protein